MELPGSLDEAAAGVVLFSGMWPWTAAGSDGFVMEVVY